MQAQFKALLFGSAGLSGDEKVIKAAQDMFKAFAAGDRKAIHPNIRASVYAIALQNGGEAEYDVIWNEYLTATNADERNTALRSLGHAKGENLIKRTTELPLDSHVKGQDVYLPVIGLRSEAEGIKALWAWMKTDWEKIVVKCPASLTMLGTMVSVCTASFTKEEHLKDVQAFFELKDNKGYKKVLEQSIDSIQAKVSWLKRDGEDVRAYLEKEGHFGTAGKL